MKPARFCWTAAFLLLLGGHAIAAGPSTPPPEHFTVQSDGHPMAVWARLPTTPPRGVILLLHGRTWSSLPDFDLQVPGLKRSVLESLAAKGFATYAMDARGYGGTPRDRTGWITPDRAAKDASAVLMWVAARHPGLPPPTLVGWSTGGAVAHLTAATYPMLISSLVLFGYAPDPDAVYTPPDDQPSRPPMVKNTVENAGRDFISPKVTPKKVQAAFVEAALKSDPLYADWRLEEQFIQDSTRLTMPTLVMYGDRDPEVDAKKAAKFLARVVTTDKAIVALPGADHCAHLEDTHDAWIGAIVSFISRQPR